VITPQPVACLDLPPGLPTQDCGRIRERDPGDLRVAGRRLSRRPLTRVDSCPRFVSIAADPIATRAGKRRPMNAFRENFTPKHDRGSCPLWN
jgi:hypothetical protein